MQSPALVTSIPAVPRGLGVFVAGVSAVVLLSSLVGAGAAALNSPPVWFMLGFEVVIAVAAVFGVLTGMGRFGEGPALALVCVAGAVGAGSLLGYLAGQGNIGIGLKPFLLAREASAAAIAGAGGVIVMMRRPQVSVRRMAIGLACAGSFAGICAGLWVFGNRLSGLGTMAGALVGLASAVTLLALLAAAVHLIIGAFEAGALDEDAASAQ
jgi:hypothetical protein